jgi:hypothetical protein
MRNLAIRTAITLLAVLHIVSTLTACKALLGSLRENRDYWTEMEQIIYNIAQSDFENFEVLLTDELRSNKKLVSDWFEQVNQEIKGNIMTISGESGGGSKTKDNNNILEVTIASFTVKTETEEFQFRYEFVIENTESPENIGFSRIEFICMKQNCAPLILQGEQRYY